MSDQPIIVLWADNSLDITLTKGGSTFAISSGTTVVAALVSVDHKTKFAGDTTCLEGESGADWPNSLVVVPFAIADLAEVTHQGNALLEIRIGNEPPWFGGVMIVKGLTS